MVDHTTIIYSTVTFYLHQQFDLAVPHAIGTSAAGNTINNLNLGFNDNYEIHLEFLKELDSNGAQCSSYSTHSYTQVQTTNKY